jgi:hypothetical protein
MVPERQVRAVVWCTEESNASYVFEDIRVVLVLLVCADNCLLGD